MTKQSVFFVFQLAGIILAIRLRNYMARRQSRK